MSYLLITITYISVCFMLFGIYPGEKQTIQYVLGTISILANSIIEISARIAGKSSKELLHIGTIAFPYVRALAICCFGMWIGLMIWLFSYRSKKIEEHQGVDGCYVQNARSFK